jgi:hypothetical protein
MDRGHLVALLVGSLVLFTGTQSFGQSKKLGLRPLNDGHFLRTVFGGLYPPYPMVLTEGGSTLALRKNQMVLLSVKANLKRIQIADDSVAEYTLLSTREILLKGQKAGRTMLTLWFPDQDDPQMEVVIRHLVQVSP